MTLQQTAVNLTAALFVNATVPPFAQYLATGQAICALTSAQFLEYSPLITNATRRAFEKAALAAAANEVAQGLVRTRAWGRKEGGGSN